MGAFLLVHQSNNAFNIPKAMQVMTTMGLREPHAITLGKWKAYSWSKMRLDEPHYYCKGNATLICAGTPIYQHTASFAESLAKIMDDLQHNRFDYRLVRGSYALLYSSDGVSVQLLTDQAGIYNVYHDDQHQAISTSFLSLIFGLNKPLKLNHFAATELITTGRQIGPDTLFQGISRLEITLTNHLGEIPVINDKDLQGFPEEKPASSFNAAVLEQVQAIDKYFSDIKAFGSHYGVDSGLTAGHDSRMMLIQIRKYFKNFQIHSFWRKEKDLELTVAEKVAEKAAVPLRVIPGKHHADKTNEQLIETLQKSLYFYDGHIRMHCFLMEEYHTIEHRTAILGDKYLGINGIGGEQYRNEWHMEMPTWSTDYFLHFPLAYNLSGTCFENPKFEADYFKYLEKKLLRKLGLPAGTKTLTKRDIQKYYNEVYVASLMGVRTNAENALGHFVTPFIDRQLTRLSYKGLPYHGISFGFQQAMIRKMDPELASVQSGYGYSFADGEPWSRKIKYIIKEFTPARMYQRKLDKKAAINADKDFQQLVARYPVFQSALDLLKQFGLPLNEKTLTSRPDIMPVYLSLAYFLYYLNNNGLLELHQPE